MGVHPSQVIPDGASHETPPEIDALFHGKSENPNLKWMMTGGTPMTKRKPPYCSSMIHIPSRTKRHQQHLVGDLACICDGFPSFTRDFLWSPSRPCLIAIPYCKFLVRINPLYPHYIISKFYFDYLPIFLWLLRVNHCAPIIVLLLSPMESHQTPFKLFEHPIKIPLKSHKIPWKSHENPMKIPPEGTPTARSCRPGSGIRALGPWPRLRAGHVRGVAGGEWVHHVDRMGSNRYTEIPIYISIYISIYLYIYLYIYIYIHTYVERGVYNVFLRICIITARTGVLPGEVHFDCRWPVFYVFWDVGGSARLERKKGCKD